MLRPKFKTRLSTIYCVVMFALVGSAAAQTSACVETERQICLLDGRFAVEIAWDDGRGGEGFGRPISLADNSATFWFFSPNNPEMLVKILDGRAFNDSYWVFYGSLTTLEVELTVVDTFSGRTWSVTNPAGEQTSGRDTLAFPESAPPFAPEILEPAEDGQVVSAFDVHMETGLFSDPDPLSFHHCSDYEIADVSGGGDETVWRATCVTAPASRHAHFFDGEFLGSRAGEGSLALAKNHVLRVRHRDETGAASEWAQREFRTAEGGQILALELEQVEASPAPRWLDREGRDLEADGADLSVGTEARLETGAGVLFAAWRLRADDASETTLGAAQDDHFPTRVRLRASPTAASAEALPESELHFRNEAGEDVVVHLPAATLAPGESEFFWIAEDGSTYAAGAAQNEPVFDDLARADPVPWALAELAEGELALDLVVEDLRLPVAIAFPPTPVGTGPAARRPWFYVNELLGTVQVVLADGTVEPFAENLLNFDATNQETGLAGLAIDPQSGDLFVSMTWKADPDDEDAPLYGRVMRLTPRPNGRRVDQAEVIFDTFPEFLSVSHQISNVSFGPDGKLYVQVGDGFRPETAHDPNSKLGKILRMETDGAPAIDNPFYDVADGIGAADYIYAMGFRNPFGGAWRAADETLYVVENGPSRDRFAAIFSGESYGWDADRDGVGVDDDMLVGAIYNWQPAHAPLQIAFLQEQTFGRGGFPASFEGNAYVTEFGPTFALGRTDLGKRLTEFTLAADGSLAAPPRTLVEYTGFGRSTVSGLAVGSDGIYFSDMFFEQARFIEPSVRGARVWRLRYVDAQSADGQDDEGQDERKETP